MTYEERQQLVLRGAFIGFTCLTFGLLVTAAVRSLHTWQQSSAWQDCGCGLAVTSIQTQPPFFVNLPILALMALAVRFGWILSANIRQQHHLSKLWQSGQAQRIVHHRTGLAYELVHSHDRQAVTLGLLRPRIYLTTGIVKSLAGSELTAVLRHEQAHVQRLDPLWRVIAETVGATWFWLPWLKAWSDSLASLRELVADAAATRRYREMEGLTGAILKLAQSSPMSSAVAFSPNRDRVEKLLDTNWRPNHGVWRWQHALGVFGILAGLFLFGSLTKAAPAQPLACPQTEVLCIRPDSRLFQSELRCIDGPVPTCTISPIRPRTTYVETVFRP